ILDYLQAVWSQRLVCGLFANNVVSFAAIVGPTSRMFAANVGRRVPLFVGQPPDDCGPLHIPFAPCTQLVAKPRVAPQFIVTSYPAMRDLLAPQVEHFQALLMPGVVVHLLWYVACLTPGLVPRPVLWQGQPEVEQGMLTASHIPHVDPHLTGVNFPP